MPVVEAEFLETGGATGAALGAGITSGSFTAAGEAVGTLLAAGFSGATFTGAGVATGSADAQRRRVSRCPDAFSFTPFEAPAWAGTLRRRPMIMITDQLNDSPNTSSFTDTEEPELGEDVQMDVEGSGRLMGGTVLIKEMVPDGDARDSWAWASQVADYLWRLNAKRPYGCFSNVSATTVILTLMTEFGPSDFTVNNVEAGLPNITVTFDGSQTFSECLATIARLLGGAHFYVDDDRDLHFFFEEVTDNPADVDDDNQLLLRTPPPRLTEDASQLRNSIYVKGAGARLLAPASSGATVLELDGIDVFNPSGGEAHVGCNKIRYTGVRKTLIYPPPEESPQVPGQGMTSIVDNDQNGPIETQVRYRVSFIIDGKESELGPITVANAIQVSEPTWQLPILDVDPGAAFVPQQSLYSVSAMWVTSNGKRVTGNGHSAFSSTQLTFVDNNKVTFTLTGQPYLATDDPRVTSVILGRQSLITGEYQQFIQLPIVDLGGGLRGAQAPWSDVKSDASLGDPFPEAPLSVITGFFNNTGSRVWIYGIPLGPDGTTSARKVYRQELSGQGWTEPELCMTFNDNVTQGTALNPIEDLKPTRVHSWQTGDPGGNFEPFSPAPPTPKIRLIMEGVTGLDHAVNEGDIVRIAMQVDDLDAQLFWAQQVGGDGIREHEVTDDNLRSDAQLLSRGEAEIELFGFPIKTVVYSTRDTDSTSGKTVNFNLTEPPIVVAGLKIQSVTIDEIHESNILVERYNVTASSMKYTLEDLLRRAVIRE